MGNENDYLDSEVIGLESPIVFDAAFGLGNSAAIQQLITYLNTQSDTPEYRRLFLDEMSPAAFAALILCLEDLRNAVVDIDDVPDGPAVYQLLVTPIELSAVDLHFSPPLVRTLGTTEIVAESQAINLIPNTLVDSASFALTMHDVEVVTPSTSIDADTVSFALTMHEVTIEVPVWVNHASFVLNMHNVTVDEPPFVPDSDAEAYWTAMSDEPDAARKVFINNLFLGLKGGSNPCWNDLDILVLHAAHHEQAGRVNARNPAQIMTAGTGVSHTVDRGHSGNAATTAYLRFAGLEPEDLTQYSRDDASVGVWIQQMNEVSGTARDLGCVGNNQIWLTGLSGDWRLNGAGTGGTSGAGVAALYGAVRSAGAVAIPKKNGSTSGATNTTSSTATGWQGSEISVLGGAGTTKSTNRVAASFWGGTLTDAKWTQLYNTLNTYLAAIGAV